MASFELKVRRASQVADAAFLIAVATFAIALVARGKVWPPSVVLVGLTLAYMVVGHVGRRLLTAHPGTLRGVASAIVWLSNVPFLMLLWAYVASPTRFGGSVDAGPQARWLGLPPEVLMFGVGIAMLVIGRVWIDRILRDGREAASNDSFWWSRT